MVMGVTGPVQSAAARGAVRAAARAPVGAANRGTAHDALRDQERGAARGGMRRAEVHDGDRLICQAGMDVVVLRLISKRARSFIEPAWCLDR